MLILIVGVFTLYFYRANQQQKRCQRVIQHVVSLVFGTRYKETWKSTY
jgi:preprotein translocase subunit YajC